MANKTEKPRFCWRLASLATQKCRAFPSATRPIASASHFNGVKARLAYARDALRWPLMAAFLLISAYYVIECPSCGAYQATSSRQTLKCKYCNKSRTLTSAKGSSKVNIIATLPTPQAASLVVKAANEKRAKK